MRNLAILAVFISTLFLFTGCGEARENESRNVQQISNATAAIDATLNGADMGLTLIAAKQALSAAVYQFGYIMDAVTSEIKNSAGESVQPVRTADEILADTGEATEAIGKVAAGAIEAKDEQGSFGSWLVGAGAFLASLKIVSKIPVVGTLVQTGLEWVVTSKQTRDTRLKSERMAGMLGTVLRGVETVSSSLPESGGLGKLREHLDTITDSEYNEILQRLTADIAAEKRERGQEIV